MKSTEYGQPDQNPMLSVAEQASPGASIDASINASFYTQSQLRSSEERKYDWGPVSGMVVVCFPSRLGFAWLSLRGGGLFLEEAGFQTPGWRVGCTARPLMEGRMFRTKREV